MIGLPGEESKEDVLENIRALIEYDPDYAQIAILTLYPNTQIYDQAAEKGVIQAGRWEEFATNPTKGFVVDHWEEYLTLQELVELQKLAYSKFYFRLRYILRSVMKLRSLHQLKSKVKGALKLFGS
jgi:anaerobic magnesium-protoporphyrin IX monomethyl ester cyclase